MKKEKLRNGVKFQKLCKYNLKYYPETVSSAGKDIIIISIPL